MAFTTETMIDLMAASAVYDAGREKLKEFFRPIAEQLGFSEVTDVSLSPEGGCVNFLAEWHGPYQAYNSMWFCVPADLVVSGTDDTRAFCRGLTAADEADRIRAANRVQETSERATLDQLLKKYGPPTGGVT